MPYVIVVMRSAGAIPIILNKKSYRTLSKARKAYKKTIDEDIRLKRRYEYYIREVKEDLQE